MRFFKNLFRDYKNQENKGSKQHINSAGRQLTDQQMRALLDVVIRKPNDDGGTFDWNLKKYINYVRRNGKNGGYKESVIRNVKIVGELLNSLSNEQKNYILNIAKMEKEATDCFYLNKEKTYDIYISITKIAPWNAFAFMEAANAFSDRGDEATAIKYLTKAYEMDPEDEEIRCKFQKMKSGEKIR
jgi:hypothetical protein